MSDAYLKGVLDGDGFVDYSNSNPRICLFATSESFVKDFHFLAESIDEALRIGRKLLKEFGEEFIDFEISRLHSLFSIEGEVKK